MCCLTDRKRLNCGSQTWKCQKFSSSSIHTCPHKIHCSTNISKNTERNSLQLPFKAHRAQISPRTRWLPDIGKYALLISSWSPSSSSSSVVSLEIEKRLEAGGWGADGRHHTRRSGHTADHPTRWCPGPKTTEPAFKKAKRAIKQQALLIILACEFIIYKRWPKYTRIVIILFTNVVSTNFRLSLALCKDYTFSLKQNFSYI